MATSITMQLLDYTINGDFSKAKALCDEAIVEIKKLEENSTAGQKQTITKVKNIIENLVKNQTKSAKSKAPPVKSEFHELIAASFFKVSMYCFHSILFCSKFLR
jgi:Zn-dependent M28 family amino/carboxypeptidase